MRPTVVEPRILFGRLRGSVNDPNPKWIATFYMAAPDGLVKLVEAQPCDTTEAALDSLTHAIIAHYEELLRLVESSKKGMLG